MIEGERDSLSEQVVRARFCRSWLLVEGKVTVLDQRPE